MAKKLASAEIAALPTFEQLLEKHKDLAAATDYEVNEGLLFKLPAPVQVDFDMTPNYKGKSPFMAGMVVVDKRYIGMIDKMGTPNKVVGTIEYCRVRIRTDNGVTKRNFFVLPSDITA
jgi:hypothetical protein